MRGCCVWFTGLPGSGKSTTANILKEQLEARSRTVALLDGDAVRTRLSKDLGFSKADRETHLLRIADVALEAARRGEIVLCAVISPYEAGRRRVKERIGPDRFLLVHIDTPLAVCEARDPKGMYARARRGEILHFTGVSDPYEPPVEPDLRLVGADCTPDENVQKILSRLEVIHLLDRSL